MDDLITELRLLDEHSDRMFSAIRVYMDENTRQHNELWNDLAELRDAMLALANRIEAATRTPFTEVSDASE